MRVWHPWLEEVKIVTVKWARWIFAMLILTFLIFANVAAVLTILVQLKRFIYE